MRNSVIILAVGIASIAACAQAKPRLSLPQPLDSGISRAQIFDYRQSLPNTNSTGPIYYIWGARSPANPPPAVGSMYLPYERDGDRTHTFEWYKANHPDWLVYKADRVTPAYGFTYASGNNMPLDITNPLVRDFYFNTFVAPAIARGYPMIAFDNVDLTNWDARSGHFDAWEIGFSSSMVSR